MNNEICICYGVSKKEIEELIIEKGLKTAEEVQENSNAGNACARCLDNIEEILNELDKLWKK